MVRATDSSLGVTQYRTDPVRLEGSVVGQAYVAIELARNDWADSTVDFLLVVTVIDTAHFSPLPGASLLLDVDGDSLVLAGPGAVLSLEQSAFTAHRPRGPSPASGRLASVKISPYPITAELLHRLGGARVVRVRLEGYPWPGFGRNYLYRRFAKQNFSLVNQFLAGWVDAPPQPPERPQLAFYVPSN